MSLTTALTALAVLAAHTPAPGEACRMIEPTAAQRSLEFANAFALGPFAMRTLTGAKACDFRRPGEGHCNLSSPGLVHITMNGDHVWYEVAAGTGARVEVSNGVAVCRVTRER